LATVFILQILFAHIAFLLPYVLNRDEQNYGDCNVRILLAGLGTGETPESRGKAGKSPPASARAEGNPRPVHTHR
jgi:hypothetical protein